MERAMLFVKVEGDRDGNNPARGLDIRNTNLLCVESYRICMGEGDILRRSRHE